MTHDVVINIYQALPTLVSSPTIPPAHVELSSPMNKALVG